MCCCYISSPKDANVGIARVNVTCIHGALLLHERCIMRGDVALNHVMNTTSTDIILHFDTGVVNYCACDSEH